MIGSRRRDHGSQVRQDSFSRTCRITLKRPARVVGLSHLLADPAQGAAAMRAGAGRRVQNLLARQMLGNGRRAGFCASTAASTIAATAGEAVASRSAWSVSKLSIASSSCSTSRASFSDERRIGPPVARQLELQLGDLRLCRHRIARHLGDDALQRGDVVGQALGRDRHAASGSDQRRLGSTYTNG